MGDRPSFLSAIRSGLSARAAAVVCLAVGAAILVPSLVYLWRTFGGKLPEA